MRLNSLPIVLFTFAGMLMALTARSQRLDEVKVAMSLEQASVHESLLQLQQRSNIKFTLFSQMLDEETKKVTLKAPQVSVADALKQILAGTQLRYRLVNEYVVIEKKPAPRQARTLTGSVTNSKTGEALPGVSVLIKNTNTGTATDANGKFSLRTTQDNGVLQLYYIGFKLIEVPFSSSNGAFAVKMQESPTALSEVVMTATRKTLQPVQHTRDRELLQEIRQSTSVVSGISSEQIGKLPDINTAQVAKRIAGVTITDEQFLVVRGMNQRYNVTYLGDNIAPSTEQYSRAFALNLLPTRIVDRILVYKSPRADLFGDFAGAAVKIYTKDALAVKHFDIGLRVGYLPNSTFKDIYNYKGSQTDWLGFDNGTRQLPSAVPGYGDFRKANLTPSQYAAAFDPTLTYGKKTAPVDLQFTVNYYNSFRLGSKRLYNVTGFAYTYETRSYDVYRQSGNTLTTLNSNLHGNFFAAEKQAQQMAQLNLMQNFSLKLNENHQLYFKNFLLQAGNKSTLVRVRAPNIAPPAFIDTVGSQLFKTNVLGFSQRFLYAGNIGGSHLFKSGKQLLNWNLGYTGTIFQVPDQRVINLTTQTAKASSFIGRENPQTVQMEDPDLYWVAAVRRQLAPNDIRTGIISRQFVDNRENLFNGSADYTHTLGKGIVLKTGTFHFQKTRNLFRRTYVVHDADLAQTSTPGDNHYLNPQLVWFREQDLANVWSSTYFRDDGTGLQAFDQTSPTDAYTATEQYNAGYLSGIFTPFNGKMEINAGIRMEYDRQKIAAAVAESGIGAPVLINNQAASWLPSVNIAWRPNEVWVLRGGYGRTVNRPEFREISPFDDFSYLTNEAIRGNQHLRGATIDNYDLRLELYPRKNPGESFSIGAFYKKLNNPIERIISTQVVGGESEYTFPFISYENAESATVKGLEADMRMSLSFLGGSFFKNLSLVANGAWMHSQVKIKAGADMYYGVDPSTLPPEDARAVQAYRSRPLQGQAPYVINTGLFYDNPASGTQVSVSWNVSGSTIYAVGKFTLSDYAFSSTRGSILQLPQHLLDAAVTQRIRKRWQIKLSAQNLLDKAVEWAEDADFDNKYTQEKLVQETGGGGYYKGDNIYQRYNLGRYLLLQATYSF